MCGCDRARGFLCKSCEETQCLMCKLVVSGRMVMRAAKAAQTPMPEHEGIPPAPLYIARIRAGLD